MREEVEMEVGAASPMIMSPTGLTNAVRRSKKSGGTPMTFLAAEHFQEISASTRNRGDGTKEKFKIPLVETVSEKTSDRGSFEGCKAPLMRRPKSCAEAKDVAFEVKEVAMSTPVRQAVKEQYMKPTQTKAKVIMVQAKENVQKMKPNEEQVRGCMRETRATGESIAKYANIVYEMIATECTPTANHGDHRGDDAAFFRNGSPSIRGSPDSNRNRASSPMSSDSIPHDAFRTPKSMRYPQASKIVNPMERNDHKKNEERDGSRRRDSSEETREDNSDSLDDSLDDMGDVMNKGNDQETLREIRLQMYKFDDGEKSVPKARLSRALSELSMQDATIETLHGKLEETKFRLQEKERKLHDAEAMCRKHERKIQELMERTSKEKRALQAKIDREEREKAKLQAKVGSLQKEIYRLKAALGGSPGASAMSSITDGDLKRASSHESGTDGEVWEGILSEEDRSVEVSLRAEIVTLKSQLADTHAEQVTQHSTEASRLSSRYSKETTTSRDLHMSPETSEEVLQLREKLEAVEAELASMRRSNAADLQQKLDATEDELAECTKLLEEAKIREAELRKELEAARERIAALESERQMHSLEEMEDLKLLYASDKQESEMALNQAVNDLQDSRAEVEDLKAELARVAETIREMEQNTTALTEERLKERDRLEQALHRCKDTEHQLRDRIADLEEKLEKAQAASLQLVNVSSQENVEGRSVKRKLDDSMDSETGLVTRESFQQEEKADLKEQLARSQAVEEHLRSEMEITRDLLRCAEKVVEEMEFEMKEDTRLRRDKESHLVKELDGLKNRLEVSEDKNRELIASRTKDAEELDRKDKQLRQSEAKEQALLNQVHILKTALESVEIERQQEKLEVLDELRMHEDLESRRIQEIDSLRVELANMRAKAEKSHELQGEVDKLRVRLANAEVQSEEVKKIAQREQKKKDEMSNKLQSEMSVIKQRLATIRKRNAIRRKREYRKAQGQEDASTTDDVSSSGESEQSFGFSNPSFPSPSRRSMSSEPSSPSTMNSSSFQSSPWSSSRRPHGSFPSQPRKRVDVSSLRQRLVESNERLQDANSRLSGLADSSNTVKEEQSRAENLSDEIMTLHAEHSDASSPDRSFHEKLQIFVTENKPQHPSVRWPEFEEASI
jgi:hypothetical protein